MPSLATARQAGPSRFGDERELSKVGAQCAYDLQTKEEIVPYV